jgi:hypothetical protein
MFVSLVDESALLRPEPRRVDRQPVVNPTKIKTMLNVTTFCTFVRELSPS